jgi:cytochrome c peroxidase
MKQPIRVVGCIVFGFLAVALAFQLQLRSHVSTNDQLVTPTIGNVATLTGAYNNWKVRQVQYGEDGRLVLPLHYVKGLSTEFTQAKGKATLDLSNGSLAVEVTGLPSKQPHDIWLIDNRQDSDKHATSASTDGLIRVGELQAQEGKAVLQAQLSVQDLWGFELDRLVVTRSQEDPQQAILLAGSPSLFQRLYFNEQRGHTMLAKFEPTNQSSSPTSGEFAFLVPAPAYAQQSGDPNLEALIAQGENLFFSETFNGNGRTCGTCHRAENNFTIDPAFIATLPGDDPLFVAENNEDLADLEDPTLMRQFGLIRANVDGFEDPASKFVMRSVPHMLGMSLSIQSAATEPPLEMTGWSGDGAPGSGTLRDFATGAVTQHFTKTLDRVADEDFRLPTDTELDAIEAFTLSLGRQDDLNLQTLQFTNTDAERGRVLFTTEDSQNRTVASGKCTICHGNGGALTAAGVNSNFDTGIENMLNHPAAATGQALPPDGGFGTQLDASTGGFGNGTFNIASLVEAADTAPYFHHNGATTLEDAIAHYDSNAFRNSIEGQRLMIQDSGGQELSVDVDTLAAFLRAINALENIRAVSDYLDRAKTGATVADSQRLLTLAQADIDDAVQVLNRSEMHEEDAVPSLEQAKSLAESAADAESTSERDGFIDQALAEAQAAKAFMVVDSGPDTENPTVSILAPASGSIVAGQVTISADASDDVGIDKVIFTMGTTEIGQAVAAPFNQGLDTTTFTDGDHQITVTAVDPSGNSGVASVTLTVNNTPAPDTTKPTVTILSPVAGSTASGTVTISANALDNTGIDKVIFKIGTQKIGQDLTNSFSQTWDTTAFADGAHIVKAIAVDLANNRKTATVTVTVNNAPVQCTVYSCPNPPPPPTEPPPPPTIPDGSSPDGEFEGVVTSKSAAASTVTVATDDGNVTLKITSATEFKGSIVSTFHEILVGHIAQGEFFTSVGEALWFEADLPPGL